MKRLSILLMLVCMVLPAAVSIALGDDILTPPWRGAVGSTYQNWRFDSNAETALPELVNNVYGSPSAHIVTGRFGDGWIFQYPALGSKVGYWDLGSGGTIDLTIPNQAVANHAKYVWLQITSFVDITAPAAINMPGAVKLLEQETMAEKPTNGGEWRLQQSVWRMPQSPVTETVTITSSLLWGSVVDQVVADTIHVPSFSSVIDAKTQPDGTLLEITGPVVSRKFESYFYMQDSEQITGIRVNCPPSQLPAEGTAPWVVGAVRDVNGERVIDQATVLPGPVIGALRPLGMNNRSVSTGLIPNSLLIRLWGRATVPGPSANTFLLDDGSLQPVVVELHGVQPPANGSRVTVTGVLCTDDAGTVLRVNASSPIKAW